MDNITRIEQVTKRHFSEHSRELFKSPYAGIWGRVVRDLGPMGYFLAPASSKFHLSTSGGLLAHSVNVADVALGLARSRFPGQVACRQFRTPSARSCGSPEAAVEYLKRSLERAAKKVYDARIGLC